MHGVAATLEGPFGQRPEGRLVLDQQDRLIPAGSSPDGAATAAGCATAGRSVAGKWTWKVVPAPGVLCRSIQPRCCFTMP
jgi:hypothetical protein